MSASDKGGFQLSPQQERLWRLVGERFDAAYSTAVCATIEGALDPDALRAALADVVREHEILRTTYRRLPGRDLPVQVVDGGAPLAWDAADPASLDAASGPILLARLVEAGPSRHELHLRMPSLNADAAAAALLVDEISRAYARRVGARAERQESDPGEAIQYADLAVWQRELLEGEDAEDARTFWRRQLEPPAIPAWPDAAKGPFRPAAQALELPDALARALPGLVEACGAPLEAVLLAAWRALVHRTTRQDELVLGVLRDGRGYDEIRGALGPFARVVPLRSRAAAGEAFAALAARAARELDEAAEWQEGFAWGEGDAPLPVTFEFRRLAARREAGGVAFTLGVSAGSEPVTSYIDRAVVSLVATDGPGELRLALHHDTASLGADEAALVGERLVALLAAAARDPRAPLARLPLLGERERRLVVEELSGRSEARGPSSGGDAAPVVTVRAAIARHAAEAPDRPAVQWKDRTLTYAELASRARALAARLREKGVGPGTIVGLLTPRSPEMVVGILGILEAGGAYLPLDPGYPSERLEFMLADSAAPVLVAAPGLERTITAHSAAVVTLSDEPGAAGSGVEAGSDQAAGLDDLAYVIYTSGSTGTPKGVGVTHANLAFSTAARRPVYGDPVRAYLLVSSFSFDSSVAGLFWTLCDGGALVLPEDGDERDPKLLADLVARHDVTHVLGLPSLVGLMLDHAGRLSSLETVIVAGEECPAALVAKHREALPGARLFNEYGPTEASVWCTVHDLLAGGAGPRVSIGRPIPGAFIHVLDPEGAPAPVGVAGELHVGGPGVTPGYLGRDELTAEKFVPDPFSSGSGARLYRTGDLARVRPDGLVDFLGRIDEQVKIRGYRIELGEVEGALLTHPGVREAVAVAADDGAGGKRLLAYVVPAGGGSADGDALRAHVRGRLPAHMVPSAVVAIDALPLTPNGKVDKNALPAPEDVGDAPAAESTSNGDEASPLEALLVDRWREVLKRDAIGVGDDFFELGGNSIQAAVLMNKLQSSLGEYIHVATLFRFPKISQLAAHLESEHAAAVARAVSGGVEARAPAPAPTTAATVDEMSDDEVRAALEKMLDEQEGLG